MAAVRIAAAAAIARPAAESDRALASPARAEAPTGTGLRAPTGGRLALKSAFYNGGSLVAVPGTETGGGSAKISMRVASKGAYICKDCGYIYNDRTPFDKLTSDYSCPVCAAPKRRFKPYEAPVARNANDKSVRKSRKADLQEADSALGSALPIGIAVGVAALVGVYLYTTTAF